jgi:Tol biopolymer transport system component
MSFVMSFDRLSNALSDRYRIEREIGRGGMATVYLAHDIRHERNVAVKVLLPELAAVLGAERFVQEIKTTANLQHPHILPLFDSGEADGFLYYVMPHIEGETLRDKLNRERQLGIDEVVKITSEVADALDYAHRQNVIHRDIKPENILLHDGRPMVVDFGIALAVSAAAGGRMTETGLSLGTPHYMSPEQATAEKDLTNRSDIYSLGAVLYEMLTGDPPHTGSTAQQIIMKIVTEEATPVTQTRKSVPPNVAAAVAKSLEKLPADRFATAKAFAEALGNPAFTLPTASALTAAPIRTGSPYLSPTTLIAALFAALAFAALAAWGWLRPGPPQPVSRYAVEVPPEHRVTQSFWSPIAVSPDGERLVYVGETDRGPMLFVRARDQLEPVEIPGTEGAYNPFFSPDGQRVGFMTDQEIKVVSLAGAPPITVTNESVGGPGATWAPDGYIYYDVLGIGPLRRVPSSGGVSESVGTLDSAAGEAQHVWPDALPNGRGVLMTVNRSGPGQGANDTDDIAVLDLETFEHRILTRGVYARYAASGHILYVTGGGVLMGVGFSQDRLELTGSPVVLAEGVAVRSGAGAVGLAVSNTGTLWYTTGGATGQDAEMVWMTRDGAASEVDPGWVGAFEGVALSPDGTELAVAERRSEGLHVWVKQLDRGPFTRLTFEGSNLEPTWEPDGRTVTFVSMRTGFPQLYRVLADGSARPELLFEDGSWIFRARWSPDSQWLIYDAGAQVSRDIFGFRPGVDTAAVALVATEATERDASVSPDGRWLLYRSDRTGRSEVYVRPFPNTTGSLRQVSRDGGFGPIWAHSGREIFYRTAYTNELVAAEVFPGESFTIGEQRVLFSLVGVEAWDVTPDDQRFVMARARGGASGELIVVENFFDELREKVGR